MLCRDAAKSFSANRHSGNAHGICSQEISIFAKKKQKGQMMIIPDVFFSFVIALSGSFVAALILTKKLPGKGFWLFFLVIFLATWAGGVWGRASIQPSVLRSWLPFLVAGGVAALIFSWLAPGKPSVNRKSVLSKKETMEMLEEIEQQREIEEFSYITVNIFFWVAIVLLLAAIVLSYM